MFKFNFNQDISEENDRNVTNSESTTIQWNKSRQILPGHLEPINTIINSNKSNTIIFNNIEIEYLASTDVLRYLQNKQENFSVISAEQNHSDLITAIYEGGLKIWECTYDLLDYISSEKLEFEGKNVLDLGCGSGIVGLVTFLQGSECCLQDYNEEVLRYITIPNIFLNAHRFNRDVNKVKFYSGDWNSFVDLLALSEDEKFDYIFTSETIYNPDSYPKLINVFKNLLKPTGTIYLAAKSHYFGVGGGISSFQEALDSEQFIYNTCWHCDKGVKREILEIKLQ